MSSRLDRCQSQSGHFGKKVFLCTMFSLGEMNGLGYVESVNRRTVLKLGLEKMSESMFVWLRRFGILLHRMRC